VNLISFFTVFIPILIFYSLYEKSKRDKYGLTPKRFDARPYFAMLLIVLPLVVAASFTQGFLKQYPMYKVSAAANYLGIPEAFTAGIYEIAYGLDFITVEYLFRGFFIVAMMNVLQRGAVLSMAVLYCTLHFGKPMGEALSSIVGGYILGVVAFETRSIWGGVIVHMGLAWLMELIAFLHKI
jgi:membrane protease YdiL (CAAX protease family)